jgi:cephalosporin-C deacetylase-like acetyl esterase
MRSKIFTPIGCVALALALPASVAHAQFPGAGGFGPSPAEVQAQTDAAEGQYHAYLNAIGDTQADARAQTVAAITTRAEAEQRQAEVRRKILALVGGLPKASGPVPVKRFATVEEDGFRVENIAYESFPGYWVTANVYVPQGTGPFPAMVVAPGHGAGKSSQFVWCANFARDGILTLCIDPMGQGERMQHFDPELGTSKVEPVGEHEHANQTTLLIGEHIARYWFIDGIRGVDYLCQRPDVKPDRIGTFGCSGGGTAAAYLAAMDPRIHAAAVSSFITSFKELLPGNGPQDAEQTLPRFLASGLDFADWIELAAPRAYSVFAYDQDFFPIAGAKWTAAEASRFYGLYGAADKFQLIDGPGGHCNLGPVTPQLLAFLVKNLKGDDAPVPTFTPLSPKDPDELTVTPTGQLSTSIGSDTAEGIARRDAVHTMAPTKLLTSPAALAALQTRVRADIRSIGAVSADPGETPMVTTALKQQLDGYRLESVLMTSEPGIVLNGLIAIPDQPGPHPAILWMEALSNDRTASSPEFVRLAKSGHIVMAFQPRDVLGEPQANAANQLALGQYMPELLRAIIVGKTIVGMRADDTIRAVSWLAARPDVDRSALTVYGRGAEGIVALHAAAVDTRITEVVVENTLVSYRMALEAGLHRNLSEVDIPGILNHYDVGDLLEAISPRPVFLVNPVNPMGQPVRADGHRQRGAVRRVRDGPEPRHTGPGEGGAPRVPGSAADPVMVIRGVRFRCRAAWSPWVLHHRLKPTTRATRVPDVAYATSRRSGRASRPSDG